MVMILIAAGVAQGAYGCILGSRDPFRSFLRFITVIIIICVSSAAFSFPAAVFFISDHYIESTEFEIQEMDSYEDGDGDASFQLKSDSLPHAHAQTTKTYYKHQDSRIKKAHDLIDKDFHTL
ncbi:hypothetical protein Tco_0703627 [Tanacetum coccineum]|uniref:Uncharacterized protein n=1 Tax=Tanacetum coccineum TaxID=301880 RepID=A0ABQ4Y0W4_9ASTR